MAGVVLEGGGVGRECFNTESQEGGSVPHPGLDAASSGKVSAPGPGSPSPAQPQIDSAQRPDWPETEQWWSWKGKITTLIQRTETKGLMELMLLFNNLWGKNKKGGRLKWNWIDVKAAHLNRRGLGFLRMLLWRQMSLKKKWKTIFCHNVELSWWWCSP